jgi:hypothetical protein
VVWDATRPTATLSFAQSVTASAGPHTLTITVSEALAAGTLQLGDFTCPAGCFLGGFNTLSASQYSLTATFAVGSPGTYAVTLKDGSANDLAGNLIVGAVSSTLTFDNAAPAVQSTTWPTGTTNINNFTVTVQWSEDVTGFALNDLTCVGPSCTLQSVQQVNAGRYTVDVAFAAEGSYSLRVHPNAVTDTAGNSNAQFDTATVQYVEQQLQASFSGFPAGLTRVAVHTVTLTFTTNVASFTLTALTPLNCQLSNLQQQNATIYTFTATFTQNDNQRVSIAEGAITSALGGGVAAAQSPLADFDGVAPTTQSFSAPAAVREAEFTLTATFSEPVAVTVNDLDAFLGGGAGSGASLVSSTGATLRETHEFRVAVAPGERTITATLAPGQTSVVRVEDAAGNPLTGSAFAVSIALDTVAPTASATAPGATVTQVNSQFTVTFSERVAALLPEHLTVTNGQVSAISSSDGGRTWQVTVAADGVGRVAVALAAGAQITDLAGNALQGSASASTLFQCAPDYFGRRCLCHIPVLPLRTEYPVRLVAGAGAENSRLQNDALTLAFHESLKYDPTLTRVDFASNCPALTTIAKWSYVDQEGTGNPAVDGSCVRVWAVQAPWASVFRLEGGELNCGLLQRELAAATEFTTALRVTSVERFRNERNELVPRSVNHSLPFSLSFPTQTAFPQAQIVAYSEVFTAVAVTQQEARVTATGYEAQIDLFTSVQWPFYLKSAQPAPAVSIPSFAQGGFAVDSFTMPAECAFGATGLCTNTWTLRLTDTNARCHFGGSYSVTFELGCRSADCPLDAATRTATVSFLLTSSPHCPAVVETIGLSLSARAYERQPFDDSNGKDEFVGVAKHPQQEKHFFGMRPLQKARRHPRPPIHFVDFWLTLSLSDWHRF